jgi:hypothetical protein
MPRPGGRPINAGQANTRQSLGRGGSGSRRGGLEINLVGVEALDARLRRIELAEAKRIARRAISTALKVTQRAIRSEIRPKVINVLSAGRKKTLKSGRVVRVNRVFKRKLLKRTAAALRSAIGARYRRSSKRGVIEAKVGIHVGKVGKKHAFWAHWAALGTVERQRKKLGGWFRRRRRGSRGQTIKSRSYLDDRVSQKSLRTGKITGDDFVGRGGRKSQRSAESAMRGIVEHELQKFWNSR